MKRHEVQDRGIGLGRFPSRKFYTDYGLYKVPTTAGWKWRMARIGKPYAVVPHARFGEGSYEMAIEAPPYETGGNRQGFLMVAGS